METAEGNERLTRIGPGTPMGALLRRYWQPVAAIAELEKRWRRRCACWARTWCSSAIASSALGLIEEQCPHRGASFLTAFPTRTASAAPTTAGSSTATARAS